MRSLSKGVIFQTEDSTFRILEILDADYQLDNLKGDCYNPSANPDVKIEVLREQELKFEKLVENEGVFGYVLEEWNPSPGCGWEHVDSCWGFVGRYSETDEKFNHYIVNELKSQIGGAR